MITVFGEGRGFRVVWLLEEMGLAYQLRPVDLLAGVEEDVQRCLAGDPAVAAASHVESTQAAADRQAGCPPEQTRAEWRRAADRTIAQVRAAGDPGAEVARRAGGDRGHCGAGGVRRQHGG